MKKFSKLEEYILVYRPHNRLLIEVYLIRADSYKQSMEKFLGYFFKDENILSKFELDKKVILNLDASVDMAHILEKLTGLHILYWGIVIDSSVTEVKVLY